MIHLLARPIDWVALGPPRPHFAGESHRRGTDLPGPMAFQGMLRTALLAANGDDFSDTSPAARSRRESLVGGPARLPSGWQLHGPFLTEVSIEETSSIARPWVPAPRYLLGSPSKPLFACPCPASDQSQVRCLNDESHGAEPLLMGWPAERKARAIEGWVAPAALRWALTQPDPLQMNSHHGRTGFGGAHSVGLPPFLRRQLLPGIRVDESKGIAEDGHLYEAEVLRFANGCGVAGWLEGDALDRLNTVINPPSMAAFGWKSRPVVLEPLPNLDPNFVDLLQGKHLPDSVASDQSFYLVALTPVPCEETSESLLARAFTSSDNWPAGVQVRVVSAFTGKPQIIGGLEAGTKRARPNRAFWAPGSAWLIVMLAGDDEAASKARARALKVMNNSHFLGGSQGSFGFGHILVGHGPRLSRVWLDAARRRKEGTP